jgi:hypothetical protein
VLVVHHGGAPGELSLVDRGLTELGGSAPPLEDVLAHVGGRAAVNLELKKAGYEGDIIELALNRLQSESVLSHAGVGASKPQSSLHPRMPAARWVSARRLGKCSDCEMLATPRECR